MCGIAGFKDARQGAEAALQRLRRMADTLVHRGPDGDGYWHDADTGVGFAHRRLSIVDLSAAGAQPMHSASGRYVVVFNGEIYNAPGVRDALRAAGIEHAYRGHSDTEAMLAALDAWGLEATLPKLNGMFAIALLDRRERVLHLLRDRLGEKPLYYRVVGERLAFASELRALRQGLDEPLRIDASAVAAYLHDGYVPAPRAIYEGVHKVRPGECVSIDLGGAVPVARPWLYWDAQQVIEGGLRAPAELSAEDAVAQLRELLTDAVRLRTLSDVPLGAFLSGGIDSSVIAGLLQRVSSAPARTFSIGFGEARFDESPHAQAVAEHLGTRHTALHVSARDALDVVPLLPRIYDEPFADASQIPTYLVSKLARTDVTVSLSGDGGDELFCGYDRYPLTARLLQVQRRLPPWLRMLAAAGASAIPLAMWDALAPLVPARISVGRLGDRMYKLADRLRLADANALYESLMSYWRPPQPALAPAVRATLAAPAPFRLPLTGDAPLAARMMAHDLGTYLPGDILTKVDRASMAVSLEARVPLLDHRVVEFAWRLPLQLKLREGQSKWVLRQVLYELVPRELVDRPKHGFSVPIEHWLRGELKDWASTLLGAAEIDRWGFLDAKTVGRLLREHLGGRRAHTPQLWSALMFQAWLAEQSR